jgi:hypothetical protein
MANVTGVRTLQRVRIAWRDKMEGVAMDMLVGTVSAISGI